MKHAGSEGELFPSTTSLQSADSICTLESCILEAPGEGEGCEDNVEDSSFCLPEDALSGSLSITDEIMELLNQRGLRAEPINGESKPSESEQAKPDNKEQEPEKCELRPSGSTEDLKEAEATSSTSHGKIPGVFPSGDLASSDSVDELSILEPSQDGTEVPFCIGSSDEDLQNKENGECSAEETSLLEVQAEDEANICRTDDVKHEKVQLLASPALNKNESSGLKGKVEGQDVAEPQDTKKATLEKKDKIVKVKRDSTLTPDDRLLIERIKNYYETADAGASYLSKEESISYIPTGVVKDSILRFNYILQQEVKKDREKSKCKTNGCITELKQANCHRKPPAQAADTGKIKAETNKVGLESETEYKSCAEIRKAWKEKEKPSNAEIGRVPKRGTSRRKEMEEPGSELVIVEESDVEIGSPLPRECPPKKESVKEQPKMNVEENTKKSDSNMKTGSECLPAVANKATLCSSGNGLYEDDDIYLIENSEKIINKVQLLAKMYSEKIGRMKTQKKNGGNKTPEAQKKNGGNETPEAQKKNGGNKTPEAQKKATVKIVPQLTEESTGDRHMTEPQLYGHLMVHENLLHINCVQENSLILSAIRQSAFDLLKKEPLMTSHPTKEQLPLPKPPEVDDAASPVQERSSTEIEESEELSLNVCKEEDPLPVNLDSSPQSTPTSKDYGSETSPTSKPSLTEDRESPLTCDDLEENEISILHINVPDKVNHPLESNTLCEPTPTVSELHEDDQKQDDHDFTTSEGSKNGVNTQYIINKEETSNEGQETIVIINLKDHVDNLHINEQQTLTPILSSDGTTPPTPDKVQDKVNHLSSDFACATSESQKAPKSRGLSPSVMDVMQRLQLDSSLSIPSTKNTNSPKKLNMATRSSSFKGSTLTDREFENMIKPKPHITKQQAIVPNPGLLSPSILQKKLSRAMALSKNNLEPQPALPRRSPMAKSRSSDSEAHTPVIRSQPSIPSPSPYRNSLYSGLLLSDTKPRLLKNPVLAENRKDGEAIPLDSKLTQTVSTDEGSHKPLSSIYQKGNNPDRPVCLLPGSPVLIAVPCPPSVRQGPSSTVSEPNSRVQSPLTLRSRMFSPPPSQNPVCPKSPRVPSFSKTRSCSFTPLSFSNLERSSSSSANSTPTCTSPPPSPWSPGFPVHSRRTCGSNVYSPVDNPISPRALHSPIEENKFWCSSRSPPCLALDSNSHNIGISTHELTSIHWPDVRELRTKYGPFKVPKSTKNDLRSPSSFRQCKSLDEGSDLFFNNTSSLHFAASQSPMEEPCESAEHYESTEKLDFSDAKEKATLRASYSTTVNIQIGGSGRIASFSNAQVSLTRPLHQAPGTLSPRKININGSTLEHKNVNYRKK
ncbi:hypothetical protein GDO81_003044 [Engystomops pustulosus]|uniref:Uncharacterized protein n=1 Tax=Engystomops pustulosus TaxID=76066 RepID=A0AAV6ZZT2_ENGPU|nr:hypothetical protein GDO81_003044 [Engystomops pustulosus]